ncbi:MAG: ABC transporter ATP-binding protein [Chloroflexota bacterium]
MPDAIALRDLSKTYPRKEGGPVQAVAPLNLDIPTGQVLGFLGTNGAGKTTTIKMMCGLVAPTTGQVTLNGYQVDKQRSQAMSQIGAVLEGTRNIYWRLSPLQNLIYFGRLKGYGGRPLRQRAEQLLQELDLWDRRHDPVNDFSRGMQQKVAIACALISDPPIVLLDEPTLGLDVHAARTVKEWVKDLAGHYGKTIILTTHQLDMAETLCDRVVIIREGELVTDQPTSALLELFRQARYEIRVEGHLPDDMASMKQMPDTGLSLSYDNGHTLLSLSSNDQDKLHQVLDKIRARGIPLISVQQAEPNLEEVFVQLTGANADTHLN